MYGRHWRRLRTEKVQYSVLAQETLHGVEKHRRECHGENFVEMKFIQSQICSARKETVTY